MIAKFIESYKWYLLGIYWVIEMENYHVQNWFECIILKITWRCHFKACLRYSYPDNIMSQNNMFKIHFFNCYLTPPRSPTPYLAHRKPRNVVGSLSPAKHLVGFERETALTHYATLLVSSADFNNGVKAKKFW